MLLDARPSERLDDAASGWTRTPARQAALKAETKKPVCIVLHQEHSNPGHVGQWFARNGHALDIRKPRFGCHLPDTLAEHCGVVIFGGPMSANDKDEFIRQEIGLIDVALREKKPYLGLCLGAQMLNLHLGGKVGFHPEEMVEIGYYPLSATEQGHAWAPGPSTSTSGIAKAATCRRVRGCLPHPTARSRCRPFPMGRRPSASSSTPRSPTRRCTAGRAIIRSA